MVKNIQELRTTVAQYEHLSDNDICELEKVTALGSMIRLGLSLLDQCCKKIMATQRRVGFLTNTLEVIKLEINPEKLLLRNSFVMTYGDAAKFRSCQRIRLTWNTLQCMVSIPTVHLMWRRALLTA